MSSNAGKLIQSLNRLPATAHRPIQERLYYGPVDDFDVLHAHHRQDVAVAWKTADSFWQEKTHSRHHARAALHDLVSVGEDWDIFQSQNAFVVGSTRAKANVSVFTSAWVDLDYYNVPELEELPPLDVWERIRNTYSWLPDVTTLTRSGRGCYLRWVFDDFVGTSSRQVAKWEFAMDRLTALLKPFGADSAAKDSARVLRVWGSVNQKTGTPVGLVTDVVGRKVSFGSFTSLVIDNTPAVVVRLPEKRRDRVTPRTPATVEYLFKPRAADEQALRLHHARMRDYRALARARGQGGPILDYRERLLFWYAVSVSWTVASRHEFEREVSAFLAEHIDGNDYSVKDVGTVQKRLENALQDVSLARQMERERDPRYKARSTTIIASLEITANEQREHLEYIVAPELRTEKRKERDATYQRQKRRQDGMLPQVEYTAKVAAEASERRSRAVSMRQQGKTIAEIQAALGVSKRAVQNYLSDAKLISE